jgi:hypothetical protein
MPIVWRVLELRITVTRPAAAGRRTEIFFRRTVRFIQVIPGAPDGPISIEVHVRRVEVPWFGLYAPQGFPPYEVIADHLLPVFVARYLAISDFN